MILSQIEGTLGPFSFLFLNIRGSSLPLIANMLPIAIGLNVVVAIAAVIFFLKANKAKQETETMAEKLAAEQEARAIGEKKMEKAMAKAENAVNEAERANKAKSTFLATMSHELRTPLNCILGLSEVLRATDPTEEQKEYLGTIKSSVDALLGIVGNILDFSKIEAGHLELRPESFNLGELLTEIESLFIVLATDKGIDLKFRPESDPNINILADRNYLRQVLINLIGNALKFTDEGSVTMVLKHEKTRPSNAPDDNKIYHRVIIDIADTGIGITPEQQKKLFKPFQQLIGSDVQKYEGTGLGLVISKRIIKAMGGNILVSSNKPKGTVFSVNFVAEGFAIKSGPKLKLEKLTNTNLFKHALAETFYKHKILVADDNALNRKVMTAMLRKMGHDADFVANGLEALKYLQENETDMVLMDIMMPILDGAEATRMIREGEAGDNHKDIPIVALTAFALTSDKEKFLSYGMDHYLTKPVEPEHLRDILTKLARDRSHKDE